MKDNEITLHINVDKSIVESFDRQYTKCRTRFIRNALRLANNDKILFDKIFFCDLLSNSEIISNNIEVN